MDETDAVAESLLEDTNELAGEGDFRDEEDDGAPLGEGFGGELEVDIGLAAAGDATEEAGVAGGLLELGESALLGGIEGDFRRKRCGTALGVRKGS